MWSSREAMCARTVAWRVFATSLPWPHYAYDVVNNIRCGSAARWDLCGGHRVNRCPYRDHTPGMRAPLASPGGRLDARTWRPYSLPGPNHPQRAGRERRVVQFDRSRVAVWLARDLTEDLIAATGVGEHDRGPEFALERSENGNLTRTTAPTGGRTTLHPLPGDSNLRPARLHSTELFQKQELAHPI